MTPPYILAYLPQCEAFEGRERNFYRDTEGNVTIGVGFLAEPVITACGFPMCLPDGVTAATAQQITADYNRVKAMPPGKLAAFYATAGALVLPEAQIDQLLLSKLEGLDRELAAHFIGWDDHLPDLVKTACLDMAWELGFAGLIEGYPRFCAAIEQNNWAVCAAECFRHGPSLARNNWTKQCFLSLIQPPTIG